MDRHENRSGIHCGEKIYKKGTTIMVNEDPLPSADKLKARIEKILGKKEKYLKSSGSEEL